MKARTWPRPRVKVKSPYRKDRAHQYRPWLAGIATGIGARRIVEVGVYQGKLTAYLARDTRATVYAVAQVLSFQRLRT
jgi:predicted O-methyltransferase YrrM